MNKNPFETDKRIFKQFKKSPVIYLPVSLKQPLKNEYG
jgi:hypothetical protein